jgi:hypothetical protein
MSSQAVESSGTTMTTYEPVRAEITVAAPKAKAFSSPKEIYWLCQ